MADKGLEYNISKDIIDATGLEWQVKVKYEERLQIKFFWG